MSIAAGARTELAYITEVTKGTTPTTPTLKVLRTTSRNINRKKTMLASKEAYTHRQEQDVRHGFNSEEGSIGAEWALNTQDDWLEYLFCSTWASNVLKMGSTLKTVTVERRFPDISKYEVFRGVAVNTGAFSIKPDSIVGLNYGVLGMGSTTTPLGTATIASSTTAAATNSPFDSFIGAISIGGTPVGIVTGIDFTINNQHTLGPVVGSKYSPDVFLGTAMLDGSISMYFQDHTALTAFLAETELAVTVTLADVTAPTTGIAIDLPRIKYSGNDKDPQLTGGVIETLPFKALYDQTMATTIRLTRDVTP